MTRRRALTTLCFLFVPPALAACLLIGSSRPASAHEFKLESLMNSFVKVEGSEAHLLIRLPLHITRTIKLPVKGATIDLANAGPALRQALSGLSQDVTL